MFLLCRICLCILICCSLLLAVKLVVLQVSEDFLESLNHLIRDATWLIVN